MTRHFSKLYLSDQSHRLEGEHQLQFFKFIISETYSEHSQTSKIELFLQKAPF